MAEAVSDSTDRRKNPGKVRAGKLGAEVRWTAETRRIVRLDALDLHERALVLALIAARKSEREPPADRDPEAA